MNAYKLGSSGGVNNGEPGVVLVGMMNVPSAGDALGVETNVTVVVAVGVEVSVVVGDTLGDVTCVREGVLLIESGAVLVHSGSSVSVGAAVDIGTRVVAGIGGRNTHACPCMSLNPSTAVMSGTNTDTGPVMRPSSVHA